MSVNHPELSNEVMINPEAPHLKKGAIIDSRNEIEECLENPGDKRGNQVEESEENIVSPFAEMKASYGELSDNPTHENWKSLMDKLVNTDLDIDNFGLLIDQLNNYLDSDKKIENRLRVAPNQWIIKMINGEELSNKKGVIFSVCRIAHLNLLKLESKQLMAFINPPHLQNLTAINLAFDQITDEGVRILANSPYLQNLTHLDLGANQITDEGVRILANSPYLQNLTYLALHENLISSRMDAHLRTWAEENGIRLTI